MSATNSIQGTSAESYWRETRRPLACLVFLAPFLTAYEAGIYWLGGRDPESARNGADHWLRGGLQLLGLDQPWLLPALIVTGLLVWHLARRGPWHVSLETMTGMFAESVLFAFVLVVVGQLEESAHRTWSAPHGLAAILLSDRTTASAILFVGAGIYEEVLFRLCLLPLCYGLFRTGGISHGFAAALAIIATSLAFSLAHYVGPAGEPFGLYTFAFRAIAGLFFAALFVVRGFGITVGAHAGYDLIVGLLLAGGN
jgi:membrane protease YdiL (CAAX protease family)